MSKCIWKTAHFGANCVEIGYLLLKIMQFYVFKMASNGGRHFEINIKTQFTSQKRANSCTSDKSDISSVCKKKKKKNYIYIIYIYIYILSDLVTSQPH